MPTIDRRALHICELAAGTELWRVSRTRHADQVLTPPGVGNARFSPIEGRSHTYLAAQRSAALLESALHEAHGPNPRIYRAQLADHVLRRVRFGSPLRLLDLRDDALAKLGLTRAQVSGAGPIHYRCTRLLAEQMVAARRTVGLIWTSRQGTLHADRNRDGLAQEVLRHESLDVAIVYQPDYQGAARFTATEPLIAGDQPTRFVLELANLLRIAIL